MTISKIQKIFEQGIDINQWEILNLLKNGEDIKSLLNIRKAEGIVNLMLRKGYIDEQLNLSSIAEKILENVGEDIPTIEERIVTQQEAFSLWTIDLHKKLQDKLVELTGKKQKMISGKYSFLPNSADLGNKLEKVIRKYKITDLEKIEKVLLSYVDKCNKVRWEMCMLVDYYIIKNDSSKMMTDFENFEEKEELTNKEGKSSIEGVYFG